MFGVRPQIETRQFSADQSQSVTCQSVSYTWIFAGQIYITSTWRFTSCTLRLRQWRHSPHTQCWHFVIPWKHLWTNSIRHLKKNITPGHFFLIPRFVCMRARDGFVTQSTYHLVLEKTVRNWNSLCLLWTSNLFSIFYLKKVIKMFVYAVSYSSQTKRKHKERRRTSQDVILGFWKRNAWLIKKITNRLVNNEKNC